MFNEITGNVDLYAEELCACRIFCSISCDYGCTIEIPSVTYRVEDLIVIRADDLVLQS
jgi:hypothetical protein